MKKTIGFVITAGHLDIEWYQALSSYRFWTTAALEDLKLAAERDDFKTYVLDGQVYPLEEYLEVAPETEEEMRRLIAEGRLAVGPFYTQFDEWLPSAENMIRNCLWGKKGAEHFGRRMMAGYLPDNFGHPVQLPQIRKSKAATRTSSVTAAWTAPPSSPAISAKAMAARSISNPPEPRPISRARYRIIRITSPLNTMSSWPSSMTRPV